MIDNADIRFAIDNGYQRQIHERPAIPARASHQWITTVIKTTAPGNKQGDRE
jgi:hypothetical protein